MSTYPANAWGGVPVASLGGGVAPSWGGPSGVTQVPYDDEEYVETVVEACQGRKANGDQCRANPIRGEVYCVGHKRQMKVLDAMDAGLAETET